MFDYSQLVGSSLAPNAESGNKTIRFTNPNNVLFTFTARVKANVLSGGQTTQGQTGGSTTGGTGGSGGGTSTGGTTTNNTGGGLLTRLFKFTVNPLTRTVSVTLLQ